MKISTPWRPAAVMPAAIMVIRPAAAACWKKGGTRACCNSASRRSTTQPARKVINTIFHDVVNSSATAAPTPAFPAVDNHCG